MDDEPDPGSRSETAQLGKDQGQREAIGSAQNGTARNNRGVPRDNANCISAQTSISGVLSGHPAGRISSRVQRLEPMRFKVPSAKDMSLRE